MISFFTSFWGFSETGVANKGESVNRSSIPEVDLLLLSTGFDGPVFSAVDTSSAAAAN